MTGQSAYRGRFGETRPPELQAIPLPPQPMPGHYGLRALKAWRYVGIYAPELMACLGSVRIGPFRQVFWAVWDREAQRLHERTYAGSGARARLGLGLGPGFVRLDDQSLQIDLVLHESAGIETVSRIGSGSGSGTGSRSPYAWTRKQGDVPARGTITLAGRTRLLEARAIIDDTAAYYERHTRWRWSAGVGSTTDGRQVAWNLVAGVNDAPTGSERTIWVDGVPNEPPPCSFSPDLSSVDDLRFSAEAVRERRENRLLVRSRYRQPFGTFAGRLPGALELAAGYGVMEEHDVYW